MENSLIPWCDDTHNFWFGCTPISPGCLHCYAREQMEHRYGKCKYADGEPRVRKLNFDADIQRWRKKPFVCKACHGKFAVPMGAPLTPMCPTCGGAVRRRRVFTLSLGDLFDREVDIRWLYDALLVISRAVELDFLILTKRPQNIRNRLAVCLEMAKGGMGCEADGEFQVWLQWWLMAEGAQGPANVWLGVTGENRQCLRERWDSMVGPHGVAARQYFLSLEPLLEDIASVVEAVLIEASIRRLKVWVVPGGESGPDARVCRVEWIEKVKDVCLAYGCPVFVKQLGRNAMEAWSLVQRWPAGTTFNSFGNLCPPDYRIVCLGHPKGGDPGEWPAALRVRQEPLTDWEKDEVPL